MRQAEPEQVAGSQPVFRPAALTAEGICPCVPVQMPVYDEVGARFFKESREQRILPLCIEGRVMDHAHELVPLLPQFLRAGKGKAEDAARMAVASPLMETSINGARGVLINITNPCDIVTRELALHLGLPRGRVFGTGTGLDTSRLLSALARQTGLDHKSITCYMMGEHGNQQFAPWSCVSFRGVPLDEWAKTDERFRFDRDALQKESIGGGWVTFSGKFCTEYGIATTAARMAYAVLHDEKVILPASTELCGEYGEEGLFAGVPCVIGENGVEQVVELPLTADEKATFHACCEGIRHNMEHLKEI